MPSEPTPGTALTPARPAGVVWAARLKALLPYLLYALLAVPFAMAYMVWLANRPGLELARRVGVLLLLGVPLAAFLLFHRRPRRQSTMLFTRVSEVQRSGVGLWARLWSLPGVLRLLALTLIVIAIMGPQSTSPDRVDVEGIDVVIALDMSNSMEEADLVPDRLSAAKRVIDDFVRRRRSDGLQRGDRIGMVVFGREAYTYCPLTFDYDVLRNLVRELQLGFVDGRGTAIGNALGVALNRLRHSDAKSRVIILLTDGDNNSGNISPQQAARFARTLGVRIYTILMGQNEGADPFGRRVPMARRYPVNPKLLEEIATVTSGSPYLATDTEALETRFHQILEELERSKLKDASLARTPLYHLFGWPAFGLLLAELGLALTRLRKFPMSFVHARLLWFGLPPLIVLLTVGFVLDLARRRRAQERLGEPALVAEMISTLSTGRLVWRMLLTILGVALVLLALARPQAPGRVRLAKSRGLDLVVALDFSKSMLAADIYPSRIERAKRELERLLDELKGDCVGLVAFAGEAVSYPLTSDYAAAKLFWRDLSPQQMPIGGTAIGKALSQSTALLKRVRGASNPYAQVILLLTDGEDHDSDPLAAAKQAAQLGIRIYAVGIGSRSGELVPDPEAAPGAPRYLKDRAGTYVSSKLDEDMLQKIARVTDGEYFRVDPKQFGVERVIRAIDGLKRGESATRLVVEPRELYHVFLFPGFFLLLIEAALGDRRRPKRARETRDEAGTKGP